MPIRFHSRRIKTTISSLLHSCKLSPIIFLIILAFLSSPKLGAADYFQQYVKYEIDVELIPELGRLEGKQKLTYVNHSPDTLNVLYFHLYLNKFRSGSYAFPFSKRTIAYIDILSLENEVGKELTYEIDNTILKLSLEDSLAPNDSLKLFFDFISIMPQSQSRFGYTGDHFDVGNWYPVPAVYDRYGWHADQHIDGEFYQEWGDYNVNITVPKEFVVGASGILLNPDVLPDSVAFPNRKVSYYDIQNLDTSTVTYQFVAKNVHDFAWAADPEFVLLKRAAGETELQFYLTSYRLDEWEKIIDDCVKGFQFLEKTIGTYPYSQMTIIDGYVTAGGIEYPNIVFINDYIVDLRQLAITVIHEMAHQWFYGLLGNNQTRYGWMDEGFATYYEIETTEYLWGKKDNFFDKQNSLWAKLFGLEVNARRRNYLNYYDYALEGREEPVNTYFDQFQNDPYTAQYDKTAVILFTLQGMIGDSLFQTAIRNYFDEWKFHHPGPEDLFISFERTTNMELDWFWDEWLNKTWTCDYRLKSIKSLWKNDFDSSYYSAYLLLHRVRPITAAVNLRLTLNNGQVLDYRIPVEGWLRGEGNANDLKPWHISQKNYLVHLKLPDKISKAEVDPDHYLPDINIFNNDNKFLPPVKFNWCHRQYLEPHLDAYSATLFPSVFYNSPDGIKIGLRGKGNYLYPLYQSSAEILFSTKKGWPSVESTWHSPVSTELTNLMYGLNGYYLDGRTGGKAYVTKNTRTLSWKTGWRFQRLVEREYLITSWSSGNVSEVFFVLVKDKYYRNSLYSWKFSAEGSSSTFGSDFDFQQVELHWTHALEFDYDKKLVAQFGSGFSFGDVPEQNLFYLAQASPIRQYDHPYLRAKGTLPTHLIKDGHFAMPGGGNICGNLQTPLSVKAVGENFFSGSLQLYFPNLFSIRPIELPILREMEWNLFTDWGQVWDDKVREDQFAGEAGFSISYGYLPIWLRYFHLAKIHVDFPLWMYKTAPGYDAWDFRWTLRVDIQKIFD
jgi:hypothetical protein